MSAGWSRQAQRNRIRRYIAEISSRLSEVGLFLWRSLICWLQSMLTARHIRRTGLALRALSVGIWSNWTFAWPKLSSNYFTMLFLNLRKCALALSGLSPPRCHHRERDGSLVETDVVHRSSPQPEQSLRADHGFLKYIHYSSWPYTFCWHAAFWLFSPVSGPVTTSSLTERAIAQPLGYDWPCQITRSSC